jgi:hypothetical protein
MFSQEFTGNGRAVTWITCFRRLNLGNQ